MIGLDIGAYSIKGIEVQKKDKVNALVNFKVQGRSGEGDEKDSLAAAIKKFFREANFSGKDVNISVSGHLVIVRFVELPRMSEDELKNAVRFEVEKYIPFSIDEAILDYQATVTNPQSKNVAIIFAAVKNNFVKHHIDTVQQAGFTVKGVDVDGIALTNAFLSAYPAQKEENKDKAVALLNVGDGFLNVSIAWQGIPYVVRDIKGAGGELTEEISKTLGVGKEEAYQLKHNPPSDKKDAITNAIKPALSKMTKEISLSFGYFENQFAKEVEKIYLSGGSSGLFGLKEFLSESFDVQVEDWDPLNSIKLNENISTESLKEAKASLGVAVGLAIRDD